MGPELIADVEAVVGEGPIWHPDEQAVYWVDIPRGRLFRYDPATRTHETCLEVDLIGGLTVQADGALLLMGRGGVVRRWNHGEPEMLLDGLPDIEDVAFNDCIADPEGRVFSGVKAGANQPGRMYRLDPDGSVRVMFEGIGESNGMGFTPDCTRFYFTDTVTQKIFLFDYDRSTGNISNRHVFAEIPRQDGVPDGMTVDAEGYVWSAHWGGGCVWRHRPDGSVERRIDLPAPKVSDLAFGGDDYTDIYISTAGGNRKAEDGPLAGSLFRVNLGIAGRPEYRSRFRMN